jgi:light-regulated signal transduction histidine kinase (bacteriophytochrome)
MIQPAPSFRKADLTDCDREPIQIPGSIQPHGVLFAVEPKSLIIVQVAGDTQRLLGETHEALLGQSLAVCLGAAALDRVEEVLRKHQGLPRPFLIVEASFGGRPLQISAHQTEGLLILELEPTLRSSGPDGIEALQGMLGRTASTHSLPDLLKAVVDEVAEASGFDRVMLYRFVEDDSGHVLAEHRRSETVDSFLDLHFPAGDIPAQARELYCNNWIRAIPDVGYRPQPLEPPDNPLTGRPLDLSFSALRSVSPVHLEYLANMGVGGSMSMSLVIDGKLWGLIACHHNQPHRLGARNRATLELFAQLVSQQIRNRIDLAEANAGIQALDVEARLAAALAGAGLAGLLSAEYDQLGLIQVQGAVLLVQDEIIRRGKAPSVSELDGLRQWLDASMVDGFFATDRLSDHYPPAAAFTDSAAGVLALSISRTPGDYVLWFLPELINTVTWAGEPTKPEVHGPLGDRLTPRKSFAAWTETVRGQSRPWSAVEIESAHTLRTAIVVADLERRETERIDLERANRDLQTIAEQRKALIEDLRRTEAIKDEFVSTVNHELRTPLTSLFASLQLFGASTAGKLDAKSERLLGLARTSCTRLTGLVNDILDLEKIAAGKMDYHMEPIAAGPLIQDVVDRHRALAARHGVRFKTNLRVKGLMVCVDPSRFNQALVNLLSNAAKYSAPGDQVEIVASREGKAAIRISVTDHGPGIPEAFRERIFGRFAQADTSTTRKVGGSGLGLNITRNLIEAFGGSVSFDSVEGRGSTFHFVVPTCEVIEHDLAQAAHV